MRQRYRSPIFNGYETATRDRCSGNHRYPNDNSSDNKVPAAIKEVSCLRRATCGDEYVGETEHLCTHSTQKHNGKDFEVKVTILVQESRTQACKTLETFWINSKHPKMNHMEECLIITRDIGQYINLLF
ncbi:unnamed protein product [Angiostrongylus costaricensis]|uniref:C2H2-type domain-containing protein n=1 Tax=Angiostrongylus costaricensis TaxID=334426 RepID=A0A0R3PHN2_ANGCS|nr:unnamed protein product [Angiostrongylus costaricensis]